jgi:signal transduction histidine kinase
MEDNNLITKDLNISADDFADKEEIKKIFLTAITHQLRTSLSSARWSIEEAVKDEDCPHKAILMEGLKKIIYSINTVGEILDFTKSDFDINLIKLDKNNLIINDLIKKIFSNLNFLIQEKKIKLDFEEGDIFQTKGDEKMLGIVFTNIFDNAFRYSPGGKVTVSLKKEGSFVKITTKDTGIGIDQKDIDLLFKKSFRGKNAENVDPGESGVGLYTTEKIIKMHGGEIKISSVLNEGTTVELSLPLI